MNISIFIWLLCVVLILALIVKVVLKRKYTYPFLDYGRSDVPYITIDIQGQPLNMAVDTGCSVSVIVNGIIDKLSYEDSPRNINLSALTSDTLHSNVITVPVTIGNKEFKNDFVVHYDDDLGNFQKLYGVTLHGILGNEFLEHTKCQIDYANHKVKLL